MHGPPESLGKREGGFTLVELLVAGVVTLLVVGLMLRAFTSTVAAWRQSQQRVETFREGRLALDLMERDLKMTALAPEPGSGAGVPMLVIGYDPQTAEPDRVNEEIYAIASLRNPGKGNLCAVGYRCLWDPVGRGYVLRRSFKDSDATFDDFRNAAGQAPSFALFHSRANAVEEDLARYVWDLTFRPCEDGVVAADYPDASYSGSLPLWIEIRFKAVGAGVAEKLKSLPVTRETWSNPDDPVFKSAIAPFQQQFVTRVRLEAAGN